ncbi:MAG: DNA repair exonuclease [Planctomycetaceae bacterium]|nr:DNA repair exonuclease [Planctomycetaceae bacterium]
MFRFLHAADIHLDSPLTTLTKYPGAPVDKIRLATREALENLVQCAIDEKVAFVVIAGDVYDGDWDDYNTGHFFNSQMTRLANADIPVYLISGNHDAANKMTRHLNLPANVHQFPTHAPETVHHPHLPVSVHGQGFESMSIKQDLSLNYPVAESGRFNIGILHTSVDGREGHANYAPCTLNGLSAKGYDYWALGHTHLREILKDRPPMIAFSGNIQGRHIRETGPKGCLLIDVDDNNQICDQRFYALDTFRWEVCEVDLSQAEEPQDILDALCDGFQEVIERIDNRPAAVRVVLMGACPMHDALFGGQSYWMEQVRSLASQQSGESLWVEKVKFRTSPVKASRDLAELDGPISELSACLREWSKSEGKLNELREGFHDLRRKVPAELLQGDEGIELENPNWIKNTLEEVEKLVIGRLLSQEEQA